MIFGILLIKYNAMRKLFAIIIASVLISSCSTTRESQSTKAEIRNEKNLAGQTDIKKAVESRKFIIKFERLYYRYGGTIELKPRTNFIIIDGDKAIISAAYIGRQYDMKPISGINMRGETVDYELTSKVSKGIYHIKTKVANNAGTFDLFLSIGKNGSCNVSLSSIKIDNISYKGFIEPLKEKPEVHLQKGDVI
jgi:hypothetical protein